VDERRWTKDDRLRASIDIYSVALSYVRWSKMDTVNICFQELSGRAGPIA
jgi:hypothetical protein